MAATGENQMNLKRLISIVILTISTIGFFDIAYAWRATIKPIHQCDLYTAAEYDPEAVARHVDYRFLNENKEVAATVCREAVAQYPDSARYKFQLGRAIFVNRVANFDNEKDPLEKAKKLWEEAAAQGYAAAYYGLGELAFFYYYQEKSEPVARRIGVEYMNKYIEMVKNPSHGYLALSFLKLDLLRTMTRRFNDEFDEEAEQKLLEEIESHLILSAQMGNKQAFSNLGYHYLDNGDFVKAKKILTTAFIQGDYNVSLKIARGYIQDVKSYFIANRGKGKEEPDFIAEKLKKAYFLYRHAYWLSEDNPSVQSSARSVIVTIKRKMGREVIQPLDDYFDSMFPPKMPKTLRISDEYIGDLFDLSDEQISSN